MRFTRAFVLLWVVANHAVPATCFSAPLAGRLPAPGRPLRRACVAAPRMAAGGAGDRSKFFTMEEVNAAARANGKCYHGMPRAAATYRDASRTRLPAETRVADWHTCKHTSCAVRCDQMPLVIADPGANAQL